MFKKLLITIIILIIGTLLFFIIKVFVDRQKALKYDTIENKVEHSILDLPSNNSTPQATLPENNKNNSSTDNLSRTMKVDITQKNCNNECTNISEKHFEYCKEVCGLSFDRHKNTCEEKDGLEQDYCWKDRAIEDSDFSTCEKINDKNIYETCKNRITEDFLDDK